MHAPIADAVFAVFNRGLALRDRLQEGGEPLTWVEEQAALRQLLSTFAGSADDEVLELETAEHAFSEPGSQEERRRLTHATIGYALTCWLDEWLRQDLRLETHLQATEMYPGYDGSARFWDEARYAETRNDLDTLEAMYLCVMLGFRGGWRDKPAQLDAWATRVCAKLEQPANTWTMPAGLASPRCAVTPGDDLPFRRMAFSMLLTFSLLLPLMLVLLWRR